MLYEVITVADATLALTLNVMRRFPQSEQYLRSGFWGARGAYPLTTSLGGKTMGIVITSYSIHYTKLYEIPARRACCPPPCRPIVSVDRGSV